MFPTKTNWPAVTMQRPINPAGQIGRNPLQAIEGAQRLSSPRAAITAPASGAKVASGAPMTIVASVVPGNNPVSPIAWIEFSVDGVVVATNTSDGTNPPSDKTTIVAPSSGSHVISVRAADQSGRQVTAQTVSFTVITQLTLAPQGGPSASPPAATDQSVLPSQIPAWVPWAVGGVVLGGVAVLALSGKRSSRRSSR